MSEEVSRRGFVEQVSAVGATWMLMLSSPALADGDPHQHGGAPQRGLRFFTPAEAKEMAAIAERIIPSDDGPGAKEAGAVTFIDRGLTMFKELQPIFRNGLVDLTKRVSEKYSPATRFSQLTATQRDELLKTIEETAFFQEARGATIAGMLCLPMYGGNRGMVGWQAIGLRDAATYSAPFGYYDRPDVRRKLLGDDA